MYVHIGAVSSLNALRFSISARFTITDRHMFYTITDRHLFYTITDRHMFYTITDWLATVRPIKLDSELYRDS